MKLEDLAGLFLHFMLLSFIAVGGMHTTLPDMHRYVVELHGWMTSRQFSDAFALAQAAPGPNMMYVTLIGWQAAGWIGAVVTTVAVIVPSLGGTLAVLRWGSRGLESRLGRAIRTGLAPVTIGFMFSTVWVLLHPLEPDWAMIVVTALTLVAVLRTRLNPLWLIAAGALAGVAGLI